MPRDTEQPLSVGDIVVDRSAHVWRVAEVYLDGKMARLDFTDGGRGINASTNGLRLATVQQVAASHVCAPMPPPTRDEVAYVNYDRSRYLRRQA